MKRTARMTTARPTNAQVPAGPARARRVFRSVPTSFRSPLKDLEGAEPPPDSIAGRLLRVVDLLDPHPVDWSARRLVDRDDLLRGVSVGIEAGRAQRADEARGLGDFRPDRLTGRHVAAVRLDRPADGGHQDLGAVVSGHGVRAEVVLVGERLL